MHVKDVMTKDVLYISPNTTILEAANKMREKNCGAIPIAEDDRLIGMITDRDIVIRSIAEGKNPASTKVLEAMTPQIIYIFEDETCEACAKKMEDNKVRRLPVLNQNKRLVGMITVGDLAAKSTAPLTQEIMHSICSAR